MAAVEVQSVKQVIQRHQAQKQSQSLCLREQAILVRVGQFLAILVRQAFQGQRSRLLQTLMAT